jgi:hypothetical protein
MSNRLSVYNRLVMEAMGRGFRLRIPFDQSAPSLVDPGRPSFKTPRGDHVHAVDSREIGPLDSSEIADLLNSGLLGKLTENQVDQKRGWRDMGLDGRKADFYAMIM